MKMSKVGNQTNSQDPQAVNSRVFVGNLNTFQCSKTDVERMFQRYGRLAGISMHKGYAFVQFTNPFDARSACLGENGRTVLSQVLDVNMVAEPKPHQIGRQLQNGAKNGNDWDYYYDSYYASAAFGGAPPRLTPAAKRPRLSATTGSRNKINNNSTQQKTTTANNNTMATAAATALALTLHAEQIKVYSNPDILICGNCREMFTDLQDLLDHKKTYCKLRFTCKCHLLNEHLPTASSTSLLCVQCKDSFSSAWDLMVHAQATHTVNIYTLGVPGHHQDNDEANGNSNIGDCSNGHQDNGHTNGRSNSLGESDGEERREEDSGEEGLCGSVSSLLEEPHQKANGSNSTESSITSYDGDENSHGFDVATSQQH